MLWEDHPATYPLKVQGWIVRCWTMTPEVVDHCRRMLANGATRQQVADVIGVGVKTIYKYLPVQYGDKKSP